MMIKPVILAWSVMLLASAVPAHASSFCPVWADIFCGGGYFWGGFGF
jgi:hypothetical protein